MFCTVNYQGSANLKPLLGDGCALFRWPQSRTLTTANATQNANKEHSPLLMGMQNLTTTLEGSLLISYKMSMILPSSSIIKILSILPKEMNIYVHIKKTCTKMFTLALFTNAQTQ